MSISKRKKEKRREAYKKAVKHKMESAANLADKYANSYEQPQHKKSNAYLRNKKIVNKKLFLVAGGVLLQTFILIMLITFATVPMKDNIHVILRDYFGNEKPAFSVVELSENYIGSDNTKEDVYYADIDKPEANSSYAVIKGEDVSCKIYFGMSDHALLEGVAQLSTTSLPGFGKPIMLYGYSWTYFSGLEKYEVGDKIKITTNYGVYRYEVSEVITFKSSEKAPYDLNEEKEKLILCADSPFGAYKTEKGGTFCVIAEKVSGPEVIY